MSEWGPRGTAPNVIPALDPMGPGTYDWTSMTPAARATALVLQLENRWPLQIETVRWNRRGGIVFVTRTTGSDDGPKSNQVLARATFTSVVEALGVVKARFGLRVAHDLDRMVLTGRKPR